MIILFFIIITTNYFVTVKIDQIFKNLKHCFKPGVGKLRPAKENFAAREHVNVARRAKIYFCFFFDLNLLILFEFHVQHLKLFKDFTV